MPPLPSPSPATPGQGIAQAATPLGVSASPAAAPQGQGVSASPPATPLGVSASPGTPQQEQRKEPAASKPVAGTPRIEALGGTTTEPWFLLHIF